MKKKHRYEEGLQHGPHDRGRGAEGQHRKGDKRRRTCRRDTSIRAGGLGLGV
jgi:hypothetical protein